MQPQSAHDRHAGGRTFMHGTVEIGQQAVAQFKILSAGRFHASVMQLAGIRNGSAVVIVDFYGTGITRVPSPGKAQFPGTAMTAEKWTERSELKPTQV